MHTRTLRQALGVGVLLAAAVVLLWPGALLPLAIPAIAAAALVLLAFLLMLVLRSRVRGENEPPGKR